MIRNNLLFDYFLVLSINTKTVFSTALPARYHVSGVIQLPYAEISEPFESWVDVDLGFSRIDYYGGRFYFDFSLMISRLNKF